VDADVFPLYHAWLRDFETLDEVHETIPAVDRLLKYGRGMHHMLVGLSVPVLLVPLRVTHCFL
jgi:glutathione S-transferase